MPTSARNGSGRTELVKVRLSQVDPALRMRVAEALARSWERAGVGGAEIMNLRIVAIAALPDAALEVPRWKADLVKAGRLPPGATPKELLA